MTREELFEVNVMKKAIAYEEERLKYLRECADRITAYLSGVPAEQGYTVSRLEELVSKIIDQERNLQRLKVLCAEAQAELIKRLDRELPDNLQRTVMIEHYAFGLSLKEVGNKFHMSKRYTLKLRNQALENLNLDIESSPLVHL